MNWWHCLKLNNDDFAKSHFVAVQWAAKSLQHSGKNTFTSFVYLSSDELVISFYADGYLFNIDALDLDIEARKIERDCGKFPINIRTYHLASQTLMMNNLDMYCSAKYNNVCHTCKDVLDFCTFFANRKAVPPYICCNVKPFCPPWCPTTTTTTKTVLAKTSLKKMQRLFRLFRVKITTQGKMQDQLLSRNC